MRATEFRAAIVLLALASCSTSSNPCLLYSCPPAPDGGASAEICDPSDGQCKCGVSLSAGVVCPYGTNCDPVSLTCVSICGIANCLYTGTCDLTDGLCKCGEEICPGGDICEQDSGMCIPCAMFPCGPGFVCDPSDRLCKCYVGGPVCGLTQICAPDSGCVADPCFGVTCAAPGASCYGGVCRCGGANGAECLAPGDSCVAGACQP